MHIVPARRLGNGANLGGPRPDGEKGRTPSAGRAVQGSHGPRIHCSEEALLERSLKYAASSDVTRITQDRYAQEKLCGPFSGMVDRA